MVLLSPLFLLLGLLAVPLLLLAARRRPRMEVASLKLWRGIAGSARAARAWTWPRLTLPLVLQLLALAALALAAADPRLRPAGIPDHTIYVLDPSTPTFEAAKTELIRHLDRMQGGGAGRFSLIVAGSVPDIPAARHLDAATVRARLDPLGPGDGLSDWSAAAAWLAPIVRPDEATALHVLSPTPGALLDHFAPPANVTVTAFTPAPPPPGPLLTLDPVVLEAGLWLLTGSVSGESLPAEIAVSFAPDGGEGFLDWTPIPLAVPEDGDTARFAARLDLPGPGRLVLSAGAGRHYAYIAPPRVPSVLVVGPEAPELVRALRAIGDFEVGQAEILPAQSADYDLVVLNGLVPDAAPGTNALYLGAAALAPGRSMPGRPPAPPASARLSGWSAAHPFSDGVNWAGFGPVFYHQGLLPPGAVPVAQVGGQPVVAARTVPAGREALLALDPAAPGWAENPGFPVLLSNILSWQGLGPAPDCRAGLPCALDRAARTALIVDPDGVPAYDGRTLAVDDVLPEARFIPRRAGFYTVETETGPRPLAVNAPLRPAVAETADLPDWEPAAPLALRPWFVLLALALLAVELALYRRRSPAPLAARALTAAALISALAGLPLPHLVPDRILVAAIDPPLDGTPATALGNLPRVMTPSGGLALEANAAPPQSPPTNPRLGLESAVRLAAALAPGPAHVILAAGRHEGEGHLADLLATPNPPVVDYRVAHEDPASEVALLGIEVPREVALGETYAVTVLVHSTQPGNARLLTLRDGLPVADQDLTLVPGLNRAEAFLISQTVGSERIEVVVQATPDTFSGNNADGAFVRVAAPRSVLVLAEDRAKGRAFADLLAVQDISATVLSPGNAPRELAGWLDYAVVVLLDLPGRALAVDQLVQIEEAVARRGLGLLITGDTNAFGAGGYYGTALEALSPLSSRIPHDRPPTAIVLVIDRSGSMAGPVGPVMRIDIAKAATLNALDFLDPGDLVGIIAFDDLAHTVLPLAPLGEADVAAAVETIVPGGGTALFPALDMAVAALETSEAGLRHIVVVTDGLVEAADFSALLARAAASGITVSTVAAGTSAITDRLERIAVEGGGSHYATRDFRTLPSILVEDIMTLDEPLVSEAAPVVAGEGSAFPLPAALPEIGRYVRTSLKPGADAILYAEASGEQRPLWANWRYGAGTVMAFAANPVARPLQPWADTAQYPRLWSQAIRALIPDVLGPGLHLAATRDGGSATVTATLIGIDGEPVPGAPVSARILESGRPVPIIETAPGRYRAQVHAVSPDTITLEVAAGEISETIALYGAYPPQYRFWGDDPRALERIALASGGAVLPLAVPLPEPVLDWRLLPAPLVWIVLATAFLALDLLVLRRRRAGSAFLGVWRP